MHIHVDVPMVLGLVGLVFKMIIFAFIPCMYMSVKTPMYMDTYVCSPTPSGSQRYSMVQNIILAMSLCNALVPSKSPPLRKKPKHRLSCSALNDLYHKTSRVNFQGRKRSSDSEIGDRTSALFP